MITNYTPTALIYAYKTKEAEGFGLNPEEIHLAYQVDQPLCPHQSQSYFHMKSSLVSALNGFFNIIFVVKENVIHFYIFLFL